MINDALGNRMKEYYEKRAKYKLVRRMPVAIRLDGCHFHTFTRGFEKPFDSCMMEAMQNTMKYLCENVQGCVLGYTQSDEITLILTDYKKLTSDAYFDNEIQKICSVTASMCTLEFNRQFMDAVYSNEDDDSEPTALDKIHKDAMIKGATFDSRCFNVPKEEVTNLILWRQMDASRNSVQMVGHTYFSQKELQGKNNSEIQDMLFLEKGINWNNYPTECKRGVCCIRGENGRWFIDKEIPLFVNKDRDYIEKLLVAEEQ